jgi:hypothetical protein
MNIDNIIRKRKIDNFLNSQKLTDEELSFFLFLDSYFGKVLTKDSIVENGDGDFIYSYKSETNTIACSNGRFYQILTHKYGLDLKQIEYTVKQFLKYKFDIVINKVNIYL